MVVNAAMIVLLPSVAVSILAQGKSILYLVAAALVTGITLGLKSYLDLRSYYPKMMFRAQSAFVVSSRMMRYDVERMQSREGMDLQGTIRQASLQGNQLGIEAFWRNLRDLLVALMSAAAYLVMSAVVDWRLMPLILLPSVVKAIFDIRLLPFEEKSFNERKELGVETYFFQQECLRNEAGKDVRLYPLRHMFKEKLESKCHESLAIRHGVMKKKLIHETVFFVLRAICLLLSGWLVIRHRHEGLEAATLILFLGSIWGISTYIQDGISKIYDTRLNQKLTTDFREKIEREEQYAALDHGNQTSTTRDQVSPVRDQASPARDQASPARDHALTSRGQALTSRDQAIEPLSADSRQGAYGLPRDIVFENVSYRYPGSESEVIQSLNLTIKEGQKLALVGENGAGKTTLAMLAAGIYKPTQGRVLWDGIDVATIPRQERNRQLLFVFQDVFVFAGTLAENVCGCERQDIDEPRLWKALEEAGLEEMVRKLPKGIDTPLTTYIEKDGVQLSGGQTQRLMLARALYKDGSLLILDEPTSALDPLAEAELYRNYYRLVKDDTSIFISHRLSSTQFCDRVVFLKNGTVAEDGTHAELLALGGSYSEMFEAQAQYYKDDESTEEEAR